MHLSNAIKDLKMNATCVDKALYMYPSYQRLNRFKDEYDLCSQGFMHVTTVPKVNATYVDKDVYHCSLYG